MADISALGFGFPLLRLVRRRCIDTSAVIYPQHREARIFAQMQEDDARRTRR
jgi:hypothetical protein